MAANDKAITRIQAVKNNHGHVRRITVSKVSNIYKNYYQIKYVISYKKFEKSLQKLKKLAQPSHTTLYYKGVFLNCNRHLVVLKNMIFNY